MYLIRLMHIFILEPKKILQRKIEELEEKFWKEYNSEKEEIATPATP